MASFFLSTSLSVGQSVCLAVRETCAQFHSAPSFLRLDYKAEGDPASKWSIFWNAEKFTCQLLLVLPLSIFSLTHAIRNILIHSLQLRILLNPSLVALPFPKTKGEVGVQSTLLHFGTLLYSQGYLV